MSKPPSSSHSISPFSIFSKPFSSSSGGWSSLSHGHSSPSGGRGKGTYGKPMSMEVDEETFTKLTQQEEDDSSAAAGPMNDDAMNQMFTSTRGNVDSEDPNSQVEVVSPPQTMRGMRPPPTSTKAVMMSQGGYQQLRSQAGRAKPTSGGRNRPSSSMAIMSAGGASQAGKRPSSTFSQRPSSFDEESGDAEGFDEDAHVSMSPPVRGRGQSSSSSDKPSSSKPGSSSSSGSGWSSRPKTITYTTHGGWGGPPSGGGWGSPYSSSFGWPSSFDEDDYWPIGGGGWSSSPSSGGGWSSGGPGETDENEETAPEEPESEGPVEPVEEVGTTEEGEDRRPQSTPPSTGRRPSSAAGPTSAGRRPPTGSRPSSMPIAAVMGRNIPTSPMSNQQPRQPTRSKLPRTNEPQPELESGTGSQSESPRPVYGPPSQQQGGSGSSSSGSSSSNIGNSGSGQLMIGGQVISNQDGLLDDELIRTVQQIIMTFDKN